MSTTTVNLSDIDRHLQYEALRIIYAFQAIASVFIALRVWARCLLSREMWTGLMMWSDVFIGIAFLLSIGETTALVKVTQREGLGLHLVDIIALTPASLAEQVTTNRWNMANQLLYNPILGFVKISVILLYLRLIGSKTGLRKMCYGILVFNFALMVSIFVADCLQCLPFQYNWNKPYMDLAAQKAAGADPVTGKLNGVLITGGKCFHQGDFYVASAGMGLLTDLLVMSVPVIMVWGLQMKLKKKLIVVGILTLGMSVTCVGIARLPIVHRMFSADNPDPFYTVGFTTSSMETGLAIATACVPDLAPLAARLFPAYFGSSANSYPTNPERKGYTNNKSGYGTGTFGNRSHVEKNVTVKANSLDGSDDAGESYVMQGWRGDKAPHATINVKGGIAKDNSPHGSQEAIVSQKQGITKTTQFVIQDDRDEDGKRWSAV